jgi:hypothetical protein
MKIIYSSFIIFITLLSSIVYGQSVDIGLRFESFAYSINNVQEDNSQLKFMPIPFSGYLKGAINFSEKYELELKTGIMILDPFNGPEYQLYFKYGITKTLYPLITYMIHSNSGNSHMSGGAYNHRMDFIGFGVEAKIRKLFSLDLVCYVPVGEKNLEYEIDYSTNSGAAIYSFITTSKMGPMLKLGFIFNIIRF